MFFSTKENCFKLGVFFSIRMLSVMTGTRTKRKGEGGVAQFFFFFYQVSLSCGFDLGFNVIKKELSVFLSTHKCS